MPEEGNKRSGVFVTDSFLDAVGVTIAVLLLIQAIYILPGMLEGMFGGALSGLWGVNWSAVYNISLVLAAIFVVLFIAGTVYALKRHSEVVRAENRILDQLTRDAISGEATENTRWQKVLSYAASDDHELWRLAIIEADVMLDEMLAQMGYTQDSLGGKLRSVERADFYTIDEAWEAHKVRNTIAHEGSGYDLGRRELENVIDKYRKVFKEFSYI